MVGKDRRRKRRLRRRLKFPRPCLSRTAEQITDTPVPQVIEELIEVFDEQLVDIPVLRVAEKFIEIFTLFFQNRVQQRIVEQITETPRVSLADEITETPQIQTQKEIICCLKEDQSEFSEERRLNVPFEMRRQELRE